MPIQYITIHYITYIACMTFFTYFILYILYMLYTHYIHYIHYGVGRLGRFSAQTQGGLCWTEAGIMRSACLYGSSLGLCWAQVVPMLGQVGPMLSHVGPIWPMLGLCCAYVGLCWALLGAMLGPCLGHLCWTDLKMPIFPPRAPSWSPKPRKNGCFVTSPRWNPLPPKGPKHVKNDVF